MCAWGERETPISKSLKRRRKQNPGGTIKNGRRETKRYLVTGETKKNRANNFSIANWEFQNATTKFFLQPFHTEFCYCHSACDELQEARIVVSSPTKPHSYFCHFPRVFTPRFHSLNSRKTLIHNLLLSPSFSAVKRRFHGNGFSPYVGLIHQRMHKRALRFYEL